jgi:hypothetical protein
MRGDLRFITFFTAVRDAAGNEPKQGNETVMVAVPQQKHR